VKQSTIIRSDRFGRFVIWPITRCILPFARGVAFANLGGSRDNQSNARPFSTVPYGYSGDTADLVTVSTTAAPPRRSALRRLLVIDAFTTVDLHAGIRSLVLLGPGRNVFNEY
jgi:hypothetical protein